jgi:hypothetical protein
MTRETYIEPRLSSKAWFPTSARRTLEITSLLCHQLAGFDEKGNLYKTQTVSCQTSAPTICRKNKGKDQLPVPPVGRI